MNYVVVEQQGRGTYRHSPGAYLAALPEIAPALPPGARAFATDPDHYDFSAARCVKDLRPLSLPHADGAPERFEIGRRR